MRTLTLLLAACSAFGQSSEERTKRALDQLLAHRFREFYAMFSPQMKNGISLETYSVLAGCRELVRALRILLPIALGGFEHAPQLRNCGPP